MGGAIGVTKLRMQVWQGQGIEACQLAQPRPDLSQKLRRFACATGAGASGK